MNVTQFFSSPSIQALGWSLLHSLWQGLICVVLAFVVLRCIPSKWSSLRYTIATVTLLFIFISSLITFIYLNDFDNAAHQITTPAYYTYQLVNPEQGNNYFSGVLHTVTSTLQNYLPFIVLCWGVGTLLFSFRLFGGWLAINKLKASATVIDGEWNERVHHLARKLGIEEIVVLAESAITQSPVVIGYFRPMILIPIGMFSGLSTEQLETIFIHELIHIRRRDYLVNLLQSVLEALYFFNPFVWIISGIIKREREHCCDDAVIAMHGNPLAYAHALTTLEEVRLSKAGFALSLAENKNQLLNRIKRIMEKSVKPYSLRERMIPAILLITGLVCASWLTVQSRKPVQEQNNSSTSVQQTTSGDTTIRIEKSGRYYKKTVTTMGEDGKPHEEVVEEFDGDGDLFQMPISDVYDFPLPIAPMDLNITVPPVAPIPSVEMIEAMPPIPAFIFDMNMHLNMDTVPFPPSPQFDLHHGADFERFGREFESRFKEQFGDFYEKHQNEIGDMLKELEARFDGHAMEEWAKNMELSALDEQLSKLEREEMWSQRQEHMKEFEQQMERWSEENAKNFEELNKQLEALEDSRMVFEKEFRNQLVKDGYLKDDESIKSIEINNEFIKINDKSIRDNDMKKYRELMKKNSFGMPSPPHHPGRRE